MTKYANEEAYHVLNLNHHTAIDNQDSPNDEDLSLVKHQKTSKLYVQSCIQKGFPLR